MRKISSTIALPLRFITSISSEILSTLSTFGTATLRELLLDAPSLADMIASFMGVLELIKVRKILIEESNEEGESDSVHGEETRFFINPDATDVENTDPEASFAPVPDEAQAKK